MAGRKSKTATAAKPKPKSKATAKAVVKGKGVRAAKVGTKLTAVDQVVAAAKVAKKSTKSKKTSKKTDVYAELEQLAAYIDAAKSEIASIRPDDVKDELLPSATDELDAVIDATADATNTIMDSCDLIEGVMADVSAEASSTLMDATTRIYEACTFQDITGQRIGKVVTALKTIEERIDALMYTLGDETGRNKKAKAPVAKPKTKEKPDEKKEITDEDLLEGPQLGDKAKSQAEIDDLLASFD